MDPFDFLLGLFIIWMAWILYAMEDAIRYSREVIDKDKHGN